jgi:hypothetical protein
MRKALAAAALLAAVSPALAQSAGAPDARLTRPGWEIGAQVSSYHYEEPNFAKLTGDRAGITGAYTYADETHLFSRLEGRVSYGRLKYEGSGTMDNVPDWIAELRLLAGKDFLAGESLALSPYLGFGYRFLYDDLRGYSDTGAAGYRRYSNYLYVPVGLTLRFSAGSSWVIAPNVEYDYFVHGTQITKLTDTGIAGVQDVTNEQTQGYGYRGYLMFENGHWAFGPWLTYWKIKSSDSACAVPLAAGGCLTGFEPSNWTREWGVDFRYRF